MSPKSQKKRKREHRRKLAHRIVRPRNGTSILMAVLDEWTRPQMFDYDELERDLCPLADFYWRQANPIPGGVVKRSDDGRVGPD